MSADRLDVDAVARAEEIRQRPADDPRGSLVKPLEMGPYVRPDLLPDPTKEDDQP